MKNNIKFTPYYIDKQNQNITNINNIKNTSIDNYDDKNKFTYVQKIKDQAIYSLTGNAKST